MSKRIEKMTAKPLFVLLIALLATNVSIAGPDQYKVTSRYDYYTIEETAEVILWVPASKSEIVTAASISYDGTMIIEDQETVAGQLNRFFIPLEKLHHGDNHLKIAYVENNKAVGAGKVSITVREARYNEVKIDRYNGGLIVEGLPYYPFGFYTYSPVQQGLAAEEVVKGFNMMSPYQKIEGKTLKERKAYMDRCAALGMKVHYNLLSVAGGGGVGSGRHQGLSAKKRMQLLQKEVESFRDHPALLAWYISDEPVGQGVPADSLVWAYELIKELDPYHPVSVVFMTPHMAHEYSHVMDIVMADPYPIPHGSVKEVGSAAALLYDEFFMEKPVWIVPQAFGGNEWWEREPTPAELRAMTYLALVNNATGIQYFIRHGLNAFPKSTMAWNECGAMAMEFAEITPFLLSDELAPAFESVPDNVVVKSYHKDGVVLVVAVNPGKDPQEFSFSFKEFNYQGSAQVLYEDRSVRVEKRKVEDMIDGYGTRIYKIRYKALTNRHAKVHPKNKVKDASFETMAEYGIPSACYASPKGDRGATYFTDSRTKAHGSHSLRMTTPTYTGGMALSFYHFSFEPGMSYTVSIQAKALPYKYRGQVKKGLFRLLCGCAPDEDEYPEFKLSLGKDCEAFFIPDNDWKEYSFSCVPSPADGKYTVSPSLELFSEGTAWFDLLQVYPDMNMNTRVSRESNKVDVYLSSTHQGAEIYYSTDGSEPGEIKYENLFSLDNPCTVKAAAFIDNELVGYVERYVEVSLATGRYVEYKHKYSTKYDSGYKDGLVDGILATPNFKDGKWQGFEGDNFDVIVNLKSIQSVREINLRFLENTSSWIFLPEKINISWSADGKEYYPLNTENIRIIVEENNGIYSYRYQVEEGIGARYIRIQAINIGSCPEGHPGAGGKAWLFTDEIIVR